MTGVQTCALPIYPAHEASREVLLSRRTSVGEYRRVLDVAERMGFDNALVQEMEAPDFYRPDFGRGAEPFEDAARFQDRAAPGGTSGERR